MFVTPAYAQGVGASPDMFISILPFVLIFVIMYFLIIRPQRTQLKKRGEMLAAVRRGDTVVTGGGARRLTASIRLSSFLLRASMLLSVMSVFCFSRFEVGSVPIPSGSKPVATFCSSVIFSENRLVLLAIML